MYVYDEYIHLCNGKNKILIDVDNNNNKITYNKKRFIVE